MTADLEKLLQLEKVNIEIARLTDEVATLPKKVAAIEAKLAGAKQKVEAAQADIKKHDQAKRALESDIQDRNQKIIKFKEQSSSVKTNEQYKALMHEIEYAEQEIRGFEDKILVNMEEVETLNANLKAAQDELKADAAEVEKEKAHAKSLTAEDEKKLAELRQQRDELRKAVSDATLATYDRVAAKRKTALAEAFDQKCQACNVMMRPQRYNELLSGGHLITCDSCGRLLYVDPTHASEAAKVTGIKGSAASEKAWIFAPDGSGGGKFYWFANSKVGCTMCSFDAATGKVLDKNVKKKVTFRDAYPDVVSAGTPLHAEALRADELQEALPAELLEELQIQAQIAPGTTA